MIKIVTMLRILEKDKWCMNHEIETILHDNTIDRNALNKVLELSSKMEYASQLIVRLKEMEQ